MCVHVIHACACVWVHVNTHILTFVPWRTLPNTGNIIGVELYLSSHHAEFWDIGAEVFALILTRQIFPPVSSCWEVNMASLPCNSLL